MSLECCQGSVKIQTAMYLVPGGCHVPARGRIPRSTFTGGAQGPSQGALIPAFATVHTMACIYSILCFHKRFLRSCPCAAAFPTLQCLRAAPAIPHFLENAQVGIHNVCLSAGLKASNAAKPCVKRFSSTSGGGSMGGGGSIGGSGGGGGGGGESAGGSSGGGLWAAYLRLLQTQPVKRRFLNWQPQVTCLWDHGVSRHV